NYIYAYNNNDEISSILLDMQEGYENLFDAKILQRKRYAVLRLRIKALSKEIDTLFQNTQRWVMLNAAMKNSLIFLASYDNKLQDIKDKELYYKISKIVTSIIYAKRMSDFSYIQKDFDDIKIKDTYTENEKRFITTFKKHVSFIINIYPEFINIDNEIRTNKVAKIVDDLKKHFTLLYINDSDILDMFVGILFLVFITIYIYLIVILVRYIKEHNKLLETTDSLKHSLMYDRLTDIKNRIAFDEDKKKLKKPAIILLNIDRFKDINDVYGSEVGDTILKTIAHMLSDICHDKHLKSVYRIGGDEFCLLFDDITIARLNELTHRILTLITSQHFLIDNNEINISITAAINDTQPLLENADLVLKYIKKVRNRNVVIYDDSLGLQKKAQENIETINLVKKALKNDDVVIYFQPIMNLKTKSIDKFEVLVRIIDGTTVIPPFKFLDIVQKTSLYQQITKTVIEKTIQAAIEYPKYRFSINLAMADILNEPLMEELFNLFEQNIAIAGKIDIELLETEGIEDMKLIKDFIDRIHSYGSLILVDDFGSGYSNFAYFAEMEIDIIKIDGSIINEIVTNKRKHHMLESIVKFAKGMHLKIVAEFVDDLEIVEILQDLDIDYIQGYLISPPRPQPLEKVDLEF
ncbi:MAG: bifunctional diguanylate cyclase/phosphodiesterase, partial [Epsilonproteobacteria bacterium]|nr:bifunctional diguanylate cyclase/phosphodiesterase [Campylobacterota bacterium]